MNTLYVLLILAASVLGSQDLKDVCPSAVCVLQSPSKYSDKPAADIKVFELGHGSDLDVVKRIPNLEYLSVFSCNSDFKMDVLPSMKDLKKINIHGCHISELNKYQFENVINLRELLLTGNSIEKLSNETFHKLSRLTVLSLQSNLINVLPEGVFNNKEDLSWLDLSYNNISMVQKELFLGIRELTKLRLRGNPLKTIELDFPIGKYLPINLGELDLQYCTQLKDMRVSAVMGNLYLQNSGLERFDFRGKFKNIYEENSIVSYADLRRAFHSSYVQVIRNASLLQDDNDLHLIQKEIGTIKKEEENKNELSITQTTQTPRIIESEEQDMNGHSTPKTQEKGDINPVTEKETGKLTRRRDPPQIRHIYPTPSQEVNQNSKDPNYLTISIYVAAVVFIVTVIVVFLRKNICNTST